MSDEEQPTNWPSWLKQPQAREVTPEEKLSEIILAIKRVFFTPSQTLNEKKAADDLAKLLMIIFGDEFKR